MLRNTYSRDELDNRGIFGILVAAGNPQRVNPIFMHALAMVGLACVGHSLFVALTCPGPMIVPFQFDMRMSSLLSRPIARQVVSGIKRYFWGDKP